MSIEKIKNDWCFLSEKPKVDLSVYPKWFDRRHHDFFSSLVAQDTALIVELGSWVGWSTRWWCENTVADVVCVDHWAGSAEHTDFTQQDFDNLYKAFIQSCWKYRTRVSPMKMNTVQGMLKIKEYGIGDDVDVVYIDASHQYEDVITDIEMAWEIFPNATLIGDDFTWKNPTQNRRRTVSEAVNYFSKKHKVEFINSGSRYLWAIKR